MDLGGHEGNISRFRRSHILLSCTAVDSYVRFTDGRIITHNVEIEPIIMHVHVQYYILIDYSAM